MRDIFIGLMIILGCIIIADFIYTEKNSCTVDMGNNIAAKCGYLKTRHDIELKFLGRYW